MRRPEEWLPPARAQKPAYSPAGCAPEGGSTAACYFELMPLENPFQDPLRFERRVPECAVVIFGANGDLTKRKLMPALYRLAYDRRLSAGFAVVGISRTPLTDDAFRERMLEAVK